MASQAEDAERRARALNYLHDAARMVDITAAIIALDVQTVPALAVIAGAERLAKAERVGVLAGSFNPPTLAHLALAESARAIAHLDVVLWVISRVTVDKEQVTRAPLPARLAALSALVAPRAHEAVASINRGLYAEQAVALHAALPQLRELCFIVGFDKIVQIVDPRYYPDRTAALDLLFAQAELLVAPRDDEGAADLAMLFARPENQPWAACVQFVPLAPHWRTLSSSAVRQDIEAGRPITDLVPPETLALVDVGAYAA